MERIQERFIIWEPLSECHIFQSWVLIRHIYIYNILQIKSNRDTHQKDVSKLGWGARELEPQRGAGCSSLEEPSNRQTVVGRCLHGSSKLNGTWHKGTCCLLSHHVFLFQLQNLFFSFPSSRSPTSLTLSFPFSFSSLCPVIQGKPKEREKKNGSLV